MVAANTMWVSINTLDRRLQCSPIRQLYTQHDIRIGEYVEAKQIQESAPSPVYAHFHFSFDHEILFLDAMLALCVNRWIDEMILHGA